MISVALRAALSDPAHRLSSLTDDDLRDALRELDDERDGGIVETLVLAAWKRRLLSVRPAPPPPVGEHGKEFVRLMRELRDDELERRLRLARAT